MGSDGVFDNLFDKDIKACIKKHTPRLDYMAECIATHAEFVSYNEEYEGPYTVSAVEHGKSKKDHLGGKPDDITVIVARVKL